MGGGLTVGRGTASLCDPSKILDSTCLLCTSFDHGPRARFPSGAVYEGEWVNGHMHGKGTFTSRDGAHYDGANRCPVAYIESRTSKHQLAALNAPLHVVHLAGSWLDDLKHGLGASTQHFSPPCSPLRRPARPAAAPSAPTRASRVAPPCARPMSALWPPHVRRSPTRREEEVPQRRHIRGPLEERPSGRARALQGAPSHPAARAASAACARYPLAALRCAALRAALSAPRAARVGRTLCAGGK